MVQKKIIIKQSLILLIAILLVLLTLLIPREVSSQQELKAVKMGYPVHFVTQDFSNYDPPMPHSYSVMSGSPFDNRPNISYANFLISVFLILLAVEIIAFISERMFYNSKKKSKR